MQQRKALIIDDDIATLELYTLQLEAEGYKVVSAELGSEGISHLKDQDFDIVLTDLSLPDVDGIEIVKISKEIAPLTEVVVVTGFDSKEKAGEALRYGARAYVIKPVDFDNLLVTIRNAVEAKRQNDVVTKQAEEIRKLKNNLSSRNSFAGIIGGSHAMQNIYEIIENVAESDANILILGESGTGKEVIGNAIHYKSHRADKPFIKVNCSALPKDLIESQLFGHIKGSFTGANTDKIGFIGQANGGTLLLDEIGEMPIDLQPKLLRLLQEKVYYRVGGDKPEIADFRLICATNRDPFSAIADGNLREDLYYRINTIEIKIPPLRERMEDVAMLANHFLSMYAEKYNRTELEFSKAAYEQMLSHNWRGNVRELQHVIERAILLSKGTEIEKLDIAAAEMANAAIAGGNNLTVNGISPVSLATEVPQSVPDEDFFPELGKVIVSRLPETEDEESGVDVFNELEKVLVTAALERTKGNKQAAAKLLGLYRPRLYGMIKRHKL